MEAVWKEIGPVFRIAFCIVTVRIEFECRIPSCFKKTDLRIVLPTFMQRHL